MSPVLVGRDQVMQRLELDLRAALTGTGHTLLISGEEGIGKSRLIHELVGRCAQEMQPPPRVYVVSCFESDQAIPYSPLIDLLESVLDGWTPASVVAHLGTLAPYLRQLVPMVDAELPPISTHQEGIPELGQRWQHRAIERLLLGHRSDDPLLVVFEDIHWCDDASLAFLRYLARRVPAHPVALVFTCRTEDLAATHVHMLDELHRQRLIEEYTVEPLPTDDARRLIASALGANDSTDLVETIASMSEGNPYFIEELLRSTIQANAHTHGRYDLRLPRSMSLAVYHRLERLAPVTRRLLTIAAVSGRYVDVELVTALTGLSTDDVLTCIHEAIDAHLMIEEATGRVAFRHAMTQEAVYEDLLAHERKQLHRHVAETVLRLQPEAASQRPAELARHFRLAEEWEPTLQFARQAGEQAQSLFSHRAAIELYTWGIDAAERRSPEDLGDLYYHRGISRDAVGDNVGACDDFEQAVTLAKATGDIASECRYRLALGMALTGRHPERELEQYILARDLARATGDTDLLIQTLNVIASHRMHEKRPDDALRSHQEVLQLARRSGQTTTTAETLNRLALASYMLGDIRSGQSHLREALELLRHEPDHQVLVEVLWLYAMRGASIVWSLAVWSPADTRDCLNDSERAIAVARKIGWRVGLTTALTYATDILGARGMYAPALTTASEMLAAANDIEHFGWSGSAHLIHGALMTDLHQHSAARESLERSLHLSQRSGSSYLHQRAAAFLAMQHIMEGDDVRAELLLASVLDDDEPLIAMSAKHVWFARAELALLRGDSTMAIRICDRLVTSSPYASAEPDAVIPRLWYLRGRALLAARHIDEAARVLLAAHTSATRFAASPMAWRIAIALSHALKELGDTKGVTDMRQHALDTIATLAADIPDDDLRVSFMTQSQSLVPGARSNTGHRAAGQHDDGLTRREREVAVLISQGLSNREIADRLYLSERTIEKHVEHTLEKLGFSSRTQIAAWVVQNNTMHHRD